MRLGGGGARSALWRQIQADVYGYPVEIVEAEEGAAYGAALLAGVGGGVWRTVDDACDAVVRVAHAPSRPTRRLGRHGEACTSDTGAIYPATRMAIGTAGRRRTAGGGRRGSRAA